jgi:hypothetical protein
MTSRRVFAILTGAGLLAAAPALAQRAPAPGATGLPAEVLSLACAPSLAPVEPAAPLRITGGQDVFVRQSYAPGDLIAINAGTRHDIAVGQQFFVRRLHVSRGEAVTPATPAVVGTAGWIQVYSVDETMSLATIVYACDTINVGDYLEPFVLPQVTVASADRPAARRDDYGRVTMGQDRRRSFGRGDYLIVDRGSDHGAEIGTQFVLYRDKRAAGNFLFEIGEAVAIDVKPHSSTLRVMTSLDAIQEGDYAAMRK